MQVQKIILKYSFNIKRFSVYSLLAVLYCLLLVGCATAPRRDMSSRINLSEYIDIESFCKSYNFKYDFDASDDIVVLSSQDKEIRFLLNSLVGILNGAVFHLNKPPLYVGGKIMLPRQFMDKLKFIKIVTPLRPGFIFRTIVIDPGHGGKDPGAISHNGLKEKNLNLTISKYIKEGLEKQGFKVILTRTKDTYLTLLDRVRIAKKNKADLFISIHTNSNRSRQINGIEVYYLSPSRLNSSERAMKLARSEDFEGKKLPIEVKTILWDLVITKNYSYSVEFSEILYSTFKKLGFSVTAPKKAPYYVLRFAYVPSVLLEIGYLSNRYEEKALRKQTYQKQIAQAVILAAVSLTERYGSFAKNTSDNK